jgi:hypothetical protein
VRSPGSWWPRSESSERSAPRLRWREARQPAAVASLACFWLSKFAVRQTAYGCADRLERDPALREPNRAGRVGDPYPCRGQPGPGRNRCWRVTADWDPRPGPGRSPHAGRSRRRRHCRFPATFRSPSVHLEVSRETQQARVGAADETTRGPQRPCGSTGASRPPGRAEPRWGASAPAVPRWSPSAPAVPRAHPVPRAAAEPQWGASAPAVPRAHPSPRPANERGGAPVETGTPPLRVRRRAGLRSPCRPCRRHPDPPPWLASSPACRRSRPRW